MKCPSKAKTQSSRTTTLLLINDKLSSNDQTILKPNIVEHVLVWYKLLTDTIGSSFHLYALFSVWGLRMCRHQNEMKVAAEERSGGGAKGDSSRQINILQSLRSSLQLPMQLYTTVPLTGH